MYVKFFFFYCCCMKSLFIVKKENYISLETQYNNTDVHCWLTAPLLKKLNKTDGKNKSVIEKKMNVYL